MVHVRHAAVAAFLVVPLLQVLAGCRGAAPEAGESGAYDELAKVTAADGHRLETPPLLTPVEALPPALARGEHHEVIGMVATDAFTNHYTVSTRYGPLEVDGTDRLRKRIHELEVMAALEQYDVGDGKVFALAAANAATGTLEGAAQLVTRPVRTLTGIPRGAWNYGRRVAEMTRGDRTETEDSYGAELAGLAEAKRQWAYRLGVDVYSRNPYLQDALSRYAWAAFTGGLTVRLPMTVVAGPAGSALTISNTAEGMRRRLRDESPEQIRLSNRELLAAMRVPEELAEQLVGHPWYTPAEQLSLVSALEGLTVARGRDAFVQVAIGAGDHEGSWFYTRMALMLAAWQASQSEVVEIVSHDGIVLFVSGHGDVVVPLYVDHGAWSAAAVAFFAAVEAAVPAAYAGAPRVLWIAGTVTPRVRDELGARGWRILTDVGPQYLAAYDRELWLPGEAPEDRILPEIGGSR